MLTKILMMFAVGLTAGTVACGTAVVGTAAVVYQGGSASIQVENGQDDVNLKVPTVALNVAARYAPSFMPQEAIEALQPAAPLFEVLPDEIADLPDGVYVEISNEQEYVIIEKRSGAMHLRVEDRAAGELVHLRMPVSTMIAFGRGIQRALGEG